MLNARDRLAIFLQRLRILKYQALSTCRQVSGSPIFLQPVLFLGEGAVIIGEQVEFGWGKSPHLHTGYCLLHVSTPDALITIGDQSKINNNAVIRSEGPGVDIGAHALIGSEVSIYDSDFHDLSAEHRRGGQPQKAAVRIAENVFVGDRVMILKGVHIGANSVIGAGSVVSSSIPAGVIAAGSPARVIGKLPAKP